jgi:hypothetical protein
MSLTNSNTYIEPVAGTALNIARIQFNNSIRSLLTNFRAPVAPGSLNISASGAPIGVQDGMLFRSTTTNALYIADSVHVKNSPVGGNFTRIGIGNRVENGIAALAANSESYEIGELVATVSENGTLAANSRLYLCISNTKTAGSTAGFIDVGQQTGFTTSTNDNVIFTGQSVRATRFLATSNIAVNTLSPQQALHIVGNAYIQSNGFITIPSGGTAQRPASPTAGMVRFNETDVAFEGYNGVTWKPLDQSAELTIQNDTTTNALVYPIFANTTSGSTSNLSVSSTKLYYNPSTGTLNATNFNSLSDARLKSNIQQIINAIDTVSSMRGVYFDMYGKKSLGLIAQEVEELLPEVVNDGEYKTIAYGNIVAVLIEAIKELHNKVEALERKVINT